MINTHDTNHLDLNALQNGDRAEFAKLVNMYSGPIYRLALKMLKNQQDAEDILQETQKSITTVTAQESQCTPYLFMVAAVADFKPTDPKEGKVKKSSVGSSWNIELEQTTDVLATIEKSKIKTVGFKAEMDSQEGLENAISLLEKKGVDAVCYNLLDDAKSFGGSENEITFITKESQVALGRTDKLTLATKIIDQAKGLIDG